jgi:hypothetical protein
MINLEEVENELIDLLDKDKQNWVQIYRLMDEVDKEKAYTTRSFTQWVNNLADKAKVHVSLLWSRKKAGAAYDEYFKRAEEKGIKVAPLEKVNVSPDNINLVTKIAGNNDVVADELMEKVVNNKLHRADLKEAWEEVKSERVAKGLAPTRATRHDVETDTVATATDTVSAKAIVYSIRNDRTWLASTIDGYISSDYHTYKALTEFAVRTGTSRNARRIDVAVFEDLTNSVDRGSHDITVHGIEIKVSKSDLLHDTKMAEYTDFCNYFWIAVPIELVAEVEAYAMDNWGILVFDKGKMKCHRKAKTLNAVMREESLIEAIKRLK